MDLIKYSSNNEITPLAVCTVPTVKTAAGTGTTAAGTLLANGEESTIECTSGYQYGDQETQIITCDTTLANNGYPADCRSKHLFYPSFWKYYIFV